MVATEFQSSRLRPGVNLEDPSAPLTQVMMGVFKDVRGLPGCQSIYGGREIDDPTMYRLFVDWDSYEAHQALVNLESTPELLAREGTVFDVSTLTLMFSLFQLDLHACGIEQSSESITEIITVYLPTDYSVEQQEAFISKVKTLLSYAAKSKSVYYGTSHGWMRPSDDVYLSINAKAKVYSIVSGWSSLEDAKSIKQDERFSQLLRDISQPSDVIKVDTVYARFTKMG